MKAYTREDYVVRVERVQSYVADHLDDDPKPAELAQVAALSLHHFHRVFRGMTGETLRGYARRLRLERAARALRQGHSDILTLALNAGYQSHEAFTRAFASQFGVSPSKFRETPSERLARAEAAGRALPEVQIRHGRSEPYLFASRVGELAESGKAWEDFVMTAVLAGIQLGQLVGRYPDDPEITPPDRTRYDVGAVMTAIPATVPKGLHLGTLRAGRWAVTTHIGPYAQLPDVYIDLVGRWIPTQGLALADHGCIERYHNTPQDTAPDALVTEVWAPLEN